jgi:anti-sigma B factor antagonist
MKVESMGKTLQVSELKELGHSNANVFRQTVLSALKKNTQTSIEVDLSETMFVDSSGLGALLELRQTCDGRYGAIRLRNPTPPVQQILEFTRMQNVFEIVNE